jgi:hypothetical protein
LQDDTYINFLAGKNFIENGILSSSLLTKVNPTTSNLHLLLSALIYSFAGSFHTESIMKLFSISAGGFCFYFLSKIMTNCGIKRENQILCLIILSSSFPFIVWTAGAMETLFVGLCLIVAIYFFINSVNNEKNKKYFFLSAFLLILSRMDMAIVSLVLVLGIIINSKNIIITGRLSLYYFFLPVLALTIVLKLYYGSILPTPVAKVTFNLIDLYNNSLFFGIPYFLSLCILNFNFMAIFSIIFFFLKGINFNKFRSLSNENKLLFFISLAIIFYCVYIISQGNVHAMFAFRFYTPLLPAFALMLAFGLQRNNETALGHFFLTNFRKIISFVLIINSIIFFYGYYINMNFTFAKNADFYNNPNHNIRGWSILLEEFRRSGIYFGSIIPQGSKVWLGIAGVVPFTISKPSFDNLLIGVPPWESLDFVINTCDATKPLPPGFFRHEQNPPSTHSLDYPKFSALCLRQLATSRLPRIEKLYIDDRISSLPIQDIEGFEGILDMAADADARFYVENKLWDELVNLLNKLHSLSDTTTGQREYVSYGKYLSDEYQSRLTFTKPK